MKSVTAPIHVLTNQTDKEVFAQKPHYNYFYYFKASAVND